jgi:hypothetical protein
MIYENTRLSHQLNVFAGAAVFFLVVTMTTYLLQSSLIALKTIGAYAHWAILLIVLPIVGGYLQKTLRINFPVLSVVMGALASAAALDPLYSRYFWAEPPSLLAIVMYVAIVAGIGSAATHSPTRTVSMAFHLGRYSNRNTKKAGSKTKSTTRKQAGSNSKDVVALIELTVAVCSLGLSVLSIFFLGRG